MLHIISFNTIFNLLIRYKYVVFFPLMVIEGPIITIIAGFFSSLGYFDVFFLYGVAVVGDLVGDTLHYLVGKCGGVAFVIKWGKYIGINALEVEKLTLLFHRHIGKTLLLGKTTQVIGGAFLVAAGAVNVPYRTFLFFNTIGTLPKSLILLLYGYYFGKEYARVSNTLDYIGLATIVLFVGAFLIFRKKIVSLLYAQ